MSSCTTSQAAQAHFQEQVLGRISKLECDMNARFDRLEQIISNQQLNATPSPLFNNSNDRNGDSPHAVSAQRAAQPHTPRRFTFSGPSPNSSVNQVTTAKTAQKIIDDPFIESATPSVKFTFRSPPTMVKFPVPGRFPPSMSPDISEQWFSATSINTDTVQELPSAANAISSDVEHQFKSILENPLHHETPVSTTTGTSVDATLPSHDHRESDSSILSASTWSTTSATVDSPTTDLSFCSELFPDPTVPQNRDVDTAIDSPILPLAIFTDPFSYSEPVSDPTFPQNRAVDIAVGSPTTHLSVSTDPFSYPEPVSDPTFPQNRAVNVAKVEPPTIDLPFRSKPSLDPMFPQNRAADMPTTLGQDIDAALQQQKSEAALLYSSSSSDGSGRHKAEVADLDATTSWQGVMENLRTNVAASGTPDSYPGEVSSYDATSESGMSYSDVAAEEVASEAPHTHVSKALAYNAAPSHSLASDLSTITGDSHFSPLGMIQQSIQAIFSKDTDIASRFFNAAQTALKTGSSSDGKLLIDMSANLNKAIFWDSSIDASKLALLFGLKRQSSNTYNTKPLGSLNKLSLPSDLLLNFINKNPSASLEQAFSKAKKAALSKGATTLISVQLIDTQSVKDKAAKSGRRHTSFAHNFVLGVSKDGCQLWQAWGADKVGCVGGQPARTLAELDRKGCLTLGDCVAGKGPQVKSLEKATEWAKKFQKLVTVKSSAWGAKQNGLYKACFGPDLTALCYPQGRLNQLTGKFKPWVAIDVIDDVKVEDVGKFVVNMSL
ncbi:MAG: hypothetical protein M1820_002983 [Bogoriella megaspora]|nr:MAG: hypothetical protein M1820_002983 [Bogoriella megaspora]